MKTLLDLLNEYFQATERMSEEIELGKRTEIRKKFDNQMKAFEPLCEIIEEMIEEEEEIEDNFIDLTEDDD